MGLRTADKPAPRCRYSRLRATPCPIRPSPSRPRANATPKDIRQRRTREREVPSHVRSGGEAWLRSLCDPPRIAVLRPVPQTDSPLLRRNRLSFLIAVFEWMVACSGCEREPPNRRLTRGEHAVHTTEPTFSGTRLQWRPRSGCRQMRSRPPPHACTHGRPRRFRRLFCRCGQAAAAVSFFAAATKSSGLNGLTIQPLAPSDFAR